MTTKEQIAVMQAYEAGKQIEVKSDCLDWHISYQPLWNWEKNDYRVKEEPKYRPYENTEEMITDFCTRFGVKRTNFGEPFIWLKDEDGDKRLIIGFSGNKFVIGGYWKDLEELFNNFTYLDGLPCGKIEE